MKGIRQRVVSVLFFDSLFKAVFYDVFNDQDHFATHYFVIQFLVMVVYRFVTIVINDTVYKVDLFFWVLQFYAVVFNKFLYFLSHGQL